ncbi:MAG: NAD(P)H-dependent oxidoreductase subunit E, partial [Prolixibacteraceae bacterium]|nr:NAD(P)H-dependent oxidoreductase subunit E [Prolixibacteraceae bacterium]
MNEKFQNIDRIIEEKGLEKNSLIPILQAIQKEYNYLPEEVLRYLSEKTSNTPADVIGVASFYKQFRMNPAGKHMVKICVGTACHVKGSGLVLDAFRRHFELPQGVDTD